MTDGAVTGAYKADLQQVIAVLNEVLATELVCILRYKNHYYMATGINAPTVAAEFLEHANEEQMHADWIAQRITPRSAECRTSTRKAWPLAHMRNTSKANPCPT